MKSTKVFFLYMIGLVIGLLMMDEIRNYYFADQIVSPLARIKSLFVIIAGIFIMKKSVTSKGFKVFLVVYLSLWAVYIVLELASNHIHVFTTTFTYYQKNIPLITPLPFIFFWLLDKVFFVEEQKI